MTGGALDDEETQSFLARIPNVRLDKPFSAEALTEALRAVMGRVVRSVKERT
jgi:hypothetical protein